MMKLIVGLGNVGKKYEQTRHNIGFEVIDHLIERHDLKLDKQKFRGAYTVAHLFGEKVVFLEPLTYMNLSGEAVRPLMDYYNIEVEDILVLYDDLDLAQGHIRLRQKGSAGGHNGIKSLIQHLGTQEFKRIRIGIDRSSRIPVVDYVLQKFSHEEMKTMQPVIAHVADAVEAFIQNEKFENIMNQYNGEIK